MAEFEFRGGRRHAPDQRDEQFPMALRLGQVQELFPRGVPEGTRHYKPSKVLDQLPTGTCVAHGWIAQYASAPIMRDIHITPFDLYRLIVAQDEWTENDFEALTQDIMEMQFGTSVRAGAKVGQEKGWLKNYLWAKSAADVRAWMLSNLGTVVLGILWKSDMMRPDSQGVVRYTGTVEGGHCVKTTGWTDTLRYNGRRVRAARCQNSWSDKWGQKGRFWILEDDLENAIQDDGEACAPTEVPVQKVA